MANEVNYVPQIDYTSRDYVAIREDLINLIPSYNPAWTSRDPADFGMTMIELFSYMGDLINFYIDRSTNEGFIATASQRDSVLQLASMLGYTPTGTTAAITTLGFINPTDADITVPAGTQVANTSIVNGTSTQIIFETDEEVTVPAKVDTVNGTASVTATQGYTVADEVLGVSTGTPSQLFKLFNSPVISGSVKIYVNGVEYFYTSSLIEKTINDPAFTTVNDAEGNTYVVFGDGIGGRVPAAAGEITATYRVGNGLAGNVPAGSVNTFLTNISAGLTVANQAAATGGADEESTDSIRLNAPLSLKALNRAVSLKDYAYLALQVSGVAKAIADATTSNSILLYMAPFGDPGVVGTTETVAFTNVAAEVSKYFVDKAAPNVSLTILPPTYIEVDLEITLHVLPQYRQAAVSSQVLAAVRDLVSIENSFFADRIPAQFVLSAVSNVQGVDYAIVEQLSRTDQAQTFDVTSWERDTGFTIIWTTLTHGAPILPGARIKVTDVDASLDGKIWTVANNSYDGGSVGFAVYTGGLNVANTTVTGTGHTLVSTTVECAVNEIPTEGTFTITATGGIA